jgi:hypothetical protein
MVRIGFVRWLIQAIKKPENCGRTSFTFSLIPQANTYKALVKEWSGIRSNLVEKSIPTQTLSVTQIEDTYELNAIRIMNIVNSLASELANKAVNFSIATGLVDFEEYNKTASTYIVKTALVQAAARGESDPIEQLPEIDLIRDMRELRDERNRQIEERARLAREQWEAHQVDAARRAAVSDKAAAISFDLLYSMLSESEREEAKAHGRVTVKITAGTFIVPVSQHGLVRQYDNDKKYVISHCIVFQDYSIPVGDEALMKIALLKTDPKQFLKVSNKFPEQHYFR